MKAHLIAALACLTFGAPALAADYEIDNGHSMVVFTIKHLNTANFWGVLHHVTGKVVFDAANPTAGSIDVTVRADSVFTADKKRDGHLKSPDFFNAKQHPTMTFTSTKVTGSGKRMSVEGKLTLRGVTKPVTATFTHVGGGKDPWGGTRAGFEGKLTIKRSDFGMNAMMGGLSDQIDLVIAIEAIQK